MKSKRIFLSLSLVLILTIFSIVPISAKSKIKSKSVTINASAATIQIGDVIKLSAIMKPLNSTDTIKWASSDKNIANVNKYGVVTGIAEGTVTITAKTSSKKNATSKISVV